MQGIVPLFVLSPRAASLRAACVRSCSFLVLLLLLLLYDYYYDYYCDCYDYYYYCDL